MPLLNAGAYVLLEPRERSGVWERDTTLIALNYAFLILAVVITLWGSSRIARRLEALRLDPDAPPASRRRVFRTLNATGGPLTLAAATAVAFALGGVARGDYTAAAVRGATWFLLGIAFGTFLWTYASLQLGLDRLGRERLNPDAPLRDPSLGLRPLGDVAFVGLWMLLIWLVPVLLTGLSDVVGITLGLLVLTLGLGAFFASLYRLHRQMVAVKVRELALARGLYAQAYEPIRATPTLESLEAQRNLLGAADALERRAREIHEWPIDEGTFARVLTITTSVIAITIARLILDPLGL